MDLAFSSSALRRPGARASRASLLLFVGATVLVAGCDGDPLAHEPTTPPVAVASEDGATLDGSPTDGRAGEEPTGASDSPEGPLSASDLGIEESAPTVLATDVAALLAGAFSFMAPLPERETKGTFDATLLADLTVEVCAPALCGQAAVVTYRSDTGPGSETLRHDPDGPLFVVNWDTEAYRIGADRDHRIRVLVAGLELGVADVVLVGQGEGLKDAATGNTLALRDGRTLPVKFQVARNRVVVAWILAAGGATASEVAGQLVSEFGSEVDEVVSLLAFGGFPAADVAGVLRVDFGASATEAATRLGSAGLVTDASQAATALYGGGYPLSDVVEVLLGLHGQAPASVAAILHGLGIGADQAGAELRAAAGLTPSEATAALRAGGYDATAVGNWLLTEPEGFDAVEVAGLLAGAGYGVAEVAGFLDGAGLADLREVTLALLSAGFSVSDVATWIVDDGGASSEEEAAAVLQGLGLYASDVGDWLVSRGYTEDGALQVLRDAGFPAAGSAMWLVVDRGRDLQAASDALTAVGYAAGEIGDWLVDRLVALGDAPDVALRKGAAILKKAGFRLLDVGDWVLDKVGRVDDVAARVFKFAGYTAGDVAEYFSSTLGRAVDKVGAILEKAGFTAVEAAQALRGRVGATVRQVAGVLRDAFGMGSRAAAGVLAGLGASATEVGDALQSVFAETLEETAAALSAGGFSLEETADWLLGVFSASPDPLYETTATLGRAGFDFEALADWVVARFGASPDADTLLRIFLLLAAADPNDDAGAAQAMIDRLGSSLTEMAGVLDAAGRLPDAIVGTLAQLGGTAFEIAEALSRGAGRTIGEIGALLKGAGFDGEAVFDALYRASRNVLGDPAGFSLRVVFAAMTGAGYFFDDFKDRLQEGLYDWTFGVLADAMIDPPSGLSMAEIGVFLVDVAGLTVEQVMRKAHDAGRRVDEVITGLLRATTATAAEIAAQAAAIYQLTQAQVADALLRAGATADQIVEGLVQGLDAGLESAAAFLKASGFPADQVFDALYKVAKTLDDVVGDPVAFALNVALGVTKGAGYFLDDLTTHLRTGIFEWTKGVLADVLIDMPETFTIAEITEVLVAVGALTAERMVERAQAAGFPVDEVIDGLFAAGVTLDEAIAALRNAGLTALEFGDDLVDAYGVAEQAVADALRAAGASLQETADWLMARLAGVTNRLERVARALARAGYVFDAVANWTWQTTGGVLDRTVAVLRFAGYSANRIVRFVDAIVGAVQRITFRSLERAGFSATESAGAIVAEAGASFTDVGQWLFEFYGLTADETVGILVDLGAGLVDLVRVILDTFGLLITDAVGLLLQYGFSAEAILAAGG